MYSVLGLALYILYDHNGTDQHTFRGDAYVYQLMNGEIFDILHAGEVKERVFKIM
jgi:hypothetical protein